MTLLQSGITKSLAAAAYTIDQSLRFDDGDSAYLNKTFGSAGNRKTWTYSCWVKRGNMVNGNLLWTSDAWMQFWNDTVYNEFGGGSIYQYSNNLLRDPSAWYHIVWKVDTTGSPTSQMFVNGTEVSYATNNPPASDAESNIGNASEHRIGGTTYLDGYLAEVYFIDGTALDPSSFAETDSATNQWKPIDASGLTFGTNGFYQKYAGTELADSFTDSSRGYTVPSGISEIEVLVVAGGGGGSGGGNGGGGGGAGGLVYISNYAVSAGAHYDITVGAGAVALGAGNSGNDGEDSIFRLADDASGGITSVGGGGGGEGVPGKDGGSGGGGWQTGNTAGGSSTQTTTNDGYTTTGWGNDGGQGGNGSPYQGGGGGGAGEVGSPGAGTSSGDGTGGDGKAYTIADGSTSVYYTGGGGGGLQHASTPGASGGQGGGGAGGYGSSGTSLTNPTAGTANTGGGGGGGREDGGGAGGGSGVIIIYDGTTRTTFNSTSVNHTITANGDVANTRAQSKVGDSSIYFDGTGDFLTVPNSSDFHFGTGDFTVEFWVYQNASGGMIMGADAAFQFYISSGTLAMYCGTASATYDLVDDASFFGTLANDTWQHIAFVRSGTTFYGFVAGTAVTTDTGVSGSTQAFTSIVGIGEHSAGTYVWDGGYLDEIRISNSARYTSTFTPETTEFTSDSNTMLLIHSNWDGGLGADSSGNFNTFTPTNLVATDQMKDSPTNNFATMNPLDTNKVNAWNTAPIFTEGNLKTVTAKSGASNSSQCCGTFAMLAGGKWGFKYTHTVGNTDPQGEMIGIIKTEGYSQLTYLHNQDMAWFYYAGNGNAYHDGSSSSFGTALEIDDYLEFLLDTAGGTLKVKRNGVLIGTNMFSSLANTNYLVAFDGDSTFDMGGVFDFGQSGYEPSDSDYKTLCTDNLSAPEIALPGENFNTVLYTGDGADDHAITGVGFQPALVWAKDRASNYHGWWDAIRGVDSRIYSNNTDAANTGTDAFESFDSDGFTLNSNTTWNDSGHSCVAWNWLAATTFDPADDGTIVTALGRSNATAGFSIVTYTGTGSSPTTIGHGLAQTPELIISKRLDQTGTWFVGNDELTAWTYFLELDGAAVESSNAEVYTTGPDASVFSVGNVAAINYSTGTFVSYCFHSVEGYSKVGSYEGNGTVDGTFIYTGFRPALVLSKDNSSANNWAIVDDARNTYNVSNARLRPNTVAAESTNLDCYDFVSNGFKVRTTDGDFNSATYTYIYLAFASYPFKYAPAR